MKLGVLLVSIIILFSLSESFAASGCQRGTGPLSIVFIIPTTKPSSAACSTCPNNGDYWTNGSNYIVFSNSAVECNSSPYNSPSTQYVKTGELTLRTTAFNNNICYTTDGTTWAIGRAVTYTKVYNCPLDDYIFLLILPFGAFGFHYMRKRILLNLASQLFKNQIIVCHAEPVEANLL